MSDATFAALHSALAVAVAIFILAFVAQVMQRNRDRWF